jgi:hypothetical protein
MNYDDEDYLPPEFERYLRRYLKRTGIFRLYQIKRPGSGERSRLILEFVIRGYVLFHIKLWKRGGLF